MKEDQKLQGICKECTHRNSCPDAKRYLDMQACTEYRHWKKGNFMRILKSNINSNNLNYVEFGACNVDGGGDMTKLLMAVRKINAVGVNDEYGITMIYTDFGAFPVKESYKDVMKLLVDEGKPKPM